MTVLFPKPEKPRRGDAGARRWMALVAQLDCVGCGRSDVQLHHPIMRRGAQRKSSDMDVIPVCPDCHDMIHNYRPIWLANHKPDYEYIPDVDKAVKRLQKLMVGELP